MAKILWTMICTRCDREFWTTKGTEQLCRRCVHTTNLENIGK